MGCAALMVVLDTHAWLWWLHNPDKLSPVAKARIEDEQAKGSIVISAISVWEVAIKVQLGKLAIPMELYQWYALASSYPATIIEPLVPLDAIDSTRLPGDFHTDPADRIIIALARRNRADLVTSDRKILAYEHVNAIW